MSDPGADAPYDVVKQRLLEALDLAPSEVTAWLDDLARTDAAVAARVRQLLRAHHQAEGFLDAPERTSDHDPIESAAAAGTRIGPFTVERELGHGGMGTVLLASRHEGGFTQRVAIKVIRGLGGDEGAVERLREERRILATLNHALIAHFVDGGTTADGLPYLAMEYVEGVPITEYCDAHALTPRDRVRLFARVCEAVHFAHQRLVIHRDIKPSNILVTSDGVPKLLDFGIAKLIDPLRALNTATVRVLTPLYASPEQATGAPSGTPADVYSLGVLLYELLTGASPYKTVSPDSPPLAVLDAIRNEIPDRPSAAAARAGRAVEDDLDAIVLKALRKDEADRYGSVEQLADDLARYLDGRAVRAHAGSGAYRARKFVTRHRGAVAAAAVAIVSLITAAVVSTWQAQVARRERERADARFGDVRKLANAVVGPLYDAIAKVPGSTAAQNLLVKEALTYLDGLEAQAADDVDLKAELAAAYEKIGDVQGNMYVANLGDATGANASYVKMLALRKAVRAARPGDVPARLALAEAERRVGDMGVAEGRLDDAIVAYERALAVMADSATPATDEAALLIAVRIRQRLGVALNRASRRDEAARYFEEALGVIEPLASGSAMSDAVRQSVMGAHSNLGDVYFYQERFADALKQFEIGLTLARQQAAVSKDGALATRNLHLSTLRVAIVLEEMGRLDESAAMRIETLAIQNQLVALDPQNLALQFDLGVTHEQQAIVHLKRKDADAALREITICLDIFTRVFGSSAAQRGNTYIHAESLGVLGEIQLARGREAEAVAAYRRAVEVISAPGIESPKKSDRFLLYKSLGSALTAQAAKSGSAGLREQARAAYVTARDGYRALAASGDLADSAKAELAELERLLRP